MSNLLERPAAADRRRDTLSEHQEVIRAIEPAVADSLRLLLPVDRAWQPADRLAATLGKQPPAAFSWLRGGKV